MIRNSAVGRVPREASPSSVPAEFTLVVADEKAMMGLLGSRDLLLRLLEEHLAADIHVRGNRITLRGPDSDVAFAERVLRELLTLQESGSVITPDAVRRTIGMLSDAAVLRATRRNRRRRCSGSTSSPAAAGSSVRRR